MVQLRCASAAWQDLTLPSLFELKLRAAWPTAEHLQDVRVLLAEERPDALIVDCLMFGALAALEGIGVPAMVLVHSAPGALLPPGGRFEARLLDSVNHVRALVQRPPLARLWAAWEPFATICTTIRALDPLADEVPQSFDYIGPGTERVARGDWHH